MRGVGEGEWTAVKNKTMLLRTSRQCLYSNREGPDKPDKANEEASSDNSGAWVEARCREVNEAGGNCSRDGSLKEGTASIANAQQLGRKAELRKGRQRRRRERWGEVGRFEVEFG